MATRIFPISTGKASWSDNVQPIWNVQRQESASGLSRAIVEQDLPKYEYSINFPALTKAERDTLLGFFNACKGQLLPFYIKNEMDCHVEKQRLGQNIDGTYQLVKKYGDYVESVSKVDNLKVFINDTETTAFTENNGKIIMATSGVVSASYDFYEQVRFASNISFNEVFSNVWKCSIKVVTAR